MCIVADADRRGLCAEMPAAGTGAPQRVQNFAPGLSACPQFGQVSMLYLKKKKFAEYLRILKYSLQHLDMQVKFMYRQIKQALQRMQYLQ